MRNGIKWETLSKMWNGIKRIVRTTAEREPSVCFLNFTFTSSQQEVFYDEISVIFFFSKLQVAFNETFFYQLAKQEENGKYMQI